jgi:enoyl-CoA hydratase
LDCAIEHADSIVATGPLAVRASKAILAQSRQWSDGEAFDLQRAISEPVRASADAREGATAFREKRLPRWRGI